MAKIKALTSDVYNLISAGEVVDNPIGAVKELIENSVDAAARRITIDIEGGGIDLITVIDDGCGIEEGDVELAFARYATSKLARASDLLCIQSLGFRGEALASIAAVSRIKLTTRTKGMDAGVCVSVENGVVVDKHYVAANVGTKIEVRDLYYNTPARKSFLKSPAAEKTEITKFISKFIVTNPNVAITYRADDGIIYDSTGEGLDAAIYAVFGSDCLSNCIPINYCTETMRITGYIGTPEYTKANRNYQTLSVNGRCVTDDRISAAIYQAYKGYLMAHRFPFYVLNLEIPPDEVDINIHPKKSIVRFKGSRNIAGKFYHAVQDALLENTSKRSAQIFSSTSGARDDKPIIRTKQDVVEAIDQLKEDGEIILMTPDQKEDNLAIEKATEREENRRDFDTFIKQFQREVTVANARRALGLDETPRTVEQARLSIVQESETPTPPIPVSHEDDLGDDLYYRARVLGVAFKTYLILDFEDKLILVDQHAAHERILFDKFLAGVSMDMQQLLVPYVFTVREEEALFIEQNKQNIYSAGIQIEEFGHNTYQITAVATLLVNTRMKDFVDFLLSSMDEFKLDDRKLIVETIAKKACKAAVKAGDTLNKYDITYILKEIYANKILQCPHGRPITVVFTKSQIEKMFKRIV
ncbi:MAG: DNA mismatch repair endonuclease MutL [Clostridiales bacterium]|nr:DNA mismatch repair endonuclease MutL [Clostridiales bacterium]